MNPTKNSPAKSPVRGHRRRRASTVLAASPKGNLTSPEITKLFMQTQEAFHYQTALGNIGLGTRFDDWRRDQVMAAVSRPGLSKINRSHWRTVYAHFLTLSGRDDEAYAVLTSTGRKRDHGSDSDTHESSEALVHKMREALDNHAREILTPGVDHIHPGWILAAARQRTGKSTLTFETLAERLDPYVLVGLLSHLSNHIARREGRESDRRSKRSYPAKKDPGSMHESGEFDPF